MKLSRLFIVLLLLTTVILVDKNDNQIGLMPKMEAHEKALLHRAFSVFTFNEKGQLLNKSF